MITALAHEHGGEIHFPNGNREGSMGPTTQSQTTAQKQKFAVSKPMPIKSLTP